MKRYIGTKVINAKPMNRLEYNEFRGWTLPADENGADEGYLVEYVDGGKPNTPQYAGYVSWSPKEQFEKAYKFRELRSGLLPHQQRVVDELAELRDKTFALRNFIGSTRFDDVDVIEQGRMKSQCVHMTSYCEILDLRISNFQK